MNTVASSVTGYSPALLTMGREMRQSRESLLSFQEFCCDPTFLRTSMSSFLRDLSLILQQNRDRLEEAQDQRRGSNEKTPDQFARGDTVMAKTHPKSSKIRGITAKLSPHRDGIYIISKVLGPTTYQIWDPSRSMCMGTYHSDDLTYYEHHQEAEGSPVLPILRRGKRGRPRRRPNPAPRRESSDEPQIPDIPQIHSPSPTLRDPRLRQGPRSRPQRFLLSLWENWSTQEQKCISKHSRAVYYHFYEHILPYIQSQFPEDPLEWPKYQTLVSLMHFQELEELCNLNP